jgi:hypothetical protein
MINNTYWPERHGLVDSTPVLDWSQVQCLSWRPVLMIENFSDLSLPFQISSKAMLHIFTIPHLLVILPLHAMFSEIRPALLNKQKIRVS